MELLGKIVYNQLAECTQSSTAQGNNIYLNVRKHFNGVQRPFRSKRGILYTFCPKAVSQKYPSIDCAHRVIVKAIRK